MKEQNFKNHSRVVPLYHGFAFTVILALFVGSLIYLFNAFSGDANIWNALFICGVSISLLLLFWFCRSFALKAQDRAIRAEESLRYYILTKERLNGRLTMQQIIALRFAADDEFIELAKKAVDENLSSKQIKMQIKNWRSDHCRV